MKFFNHELAGQQHDYSGLDGQGVRLRIFIMLLLFVPHITFRQQAAEWYLF